MGFAVTGAGFHGDEPRSRELRTATLVTTQFVTTTLITA